jgi:hypothetical protein
MPDDASPEDGVQIPVVWVGADDLSVHHVNQFVSTVSPHEVFLTLGTIVPPQSWARWRSGGRRRKGSSSSR